MNVAEKAEYPDVMARLSAQLLDELKATDDVRVIGGGELFDTYPYRRRKR